MSDRPKRCVAVLPVIVAHHPECAAVKGRAASSSTSTSGPSQVATDAYRQGWDGIFGAKPVRGEA